MRVPTAALFALMLIVQACTSGGADDKSVSPCQVGPVSSVPPAPEEVSRTLGGVPATPGKIEGLAGSGDIWVLLHEAVIYRESRQAFSIKLGWYRVAPGEIVVTANRLDGEGTAEFEAPDGYGERGFQPSGIGFDAPGCWEITARLAESEFSFRIFLDAETAQHEE